MSARHSPESDAAFRTIVADPPWSPALGSTWATATTDKARPQKHYKTMDLDGIIANGPEGVAKQAHLYLWVLNQHVDWGYSVARAWGFEPVQMLTWCKPGMGVGRFQCNTEQILVARKGSRHGNPFGSTGGTWFTWPRGRHSEKPGQFYDLVERVSPGPYLEMYARENREGWTCVGDEVPEDWYGACGSLYCADCLPRYDASNNPIAVEMAPAVGWVEAPDALFAPVSTRPTSPEDGACYFNGEFVSETHTTNEATGPCIVCGTVTSPAVDAS